MRREIAASAQRVPRALRLQVKYGEEGKSDFWRLTFLPDLCRYVQIRTFLERPPIRTGHTHRDFDILDAKKCKEFASTISAIREPRSTTGGVNCVIGFRPDLWRDISGALTVRKRQLEKKIELLCLRDVEYRILYYMAELARAFGAKANGSEYSIPLSQGELASLIGATRETTSTTLNTLARRGLIRLGRRQLIVPSVDGVLAAADQRARAAKVP